MFYYNILLIILLSSLLLKGKYGKYVAWVGFLLMFILTYYRDSSVGTDTNNYLMYTSEHRIQEYICTFLNYLTAIGVLPDEGMMRILVVVTYLCLFLIVYVYKLDLRLVIVFFFTSNMFAAGLNVARQVASIVVLAFFLPLIFENKTKRSFLFFIGPLLAGGLHYSSFYMAFLYVFRYIKLRNRMLLVLLIVLAPLFLFDIIPVTEIIQRLIPEEYMYEYSYTIVRNESVTLLGYSYRVVILVLQAMLLNYIKDNNLKLLFVYSIILTCSGIGMNTAISRIFMINSLVIALIYSKIFQGVTYGNNKVMYLIYIFIVITGFYFAHKALSVNPDLNNYKFYIS